MGDQLVIAGERKEDTAADDGVRKHRETWSGAFCRVIALPESGLPESGLPESALPESGLADQVEAEFDNGLPCVTVPLEVSEKTRPRRASVKTSA